MQNNLPQYNNGSSQQNFRDMVDLYVKELYHIYHWAESIGADSMVFEIDKHRILKSYMPWLDRKEIERYYKLQEIVNDNKWARPETFLKNWKEVFYPIKSENISVVCNPYDINEFSDGKNISVIVELKNIQAQQVTLDEESDEYRSLLDTYRYALSKKFPWFKNIIWKEWFVRLNHPNVRKDGDMYIITDVYSITSLLEKMNKRNI